MNQNTVHQNVMVQKEPYETPRIEVVELEDQPMLLAQSPGARTQDLEEGGTW